VRQARSTHGSSRLGCVDPGPFWCVAGDRDRAENLELPRRPGYHPALPRVVRFYFIETVRLYFIVDSRHWRLDHTFAPVGRPTGNAVAERFILTMKSELIWTRDWESASELRDALADWLAIYHCERPHQALAWKTPNEKRAENLNPHMPMVA
jgi:transposase InsO family protein